MLLVKLLFYFSSNCFYVNIKFQKVLSSPSTVLLKSMWKLLKTLFYSPPFPPAFHSAFIIPVRFILSKIIIGHLIWPFCHPIASKGAYLPGPQYHNVNYEGNLPRP